MAIELGRKVVKDTESFDDYAIGISLPIQITNTAFDQTFQTIDQVKSNIKNLLLTNKGERILQPEFGSGLQAALFEFNNEDVSIQIEEAIIDSLQQWLPYVTVEEIEIEQSDYLKDRNRFNVSIKFKVGDNLSLEEVTFTV